MDWTRYWHREISTEWECDGVCSKEEGMNGTRASWTLIFVAVLCRLCGNHVTHIVNSRDDAQAAKQQNAHLAAALLHNGGLT